MDELNTVVAEQSELAESLPRLEERVSRTVIRAPMEGIVSRLNFRTPYAPFSPHWDFACRVDLRRCRL